ncbi:MAG: ATP-binding cassette domain-containing protein, partial [Phycisphaerae bacterium]
ADRAAASDALASVDLLDRRRSPLSTLSGGQRQRVLIARALASEPDLLLLDEPTANLDPAAEAGFHELLRALNQRVTIVTVSHDLRFVSRYVGKAICVSRTVHIHGTTHVTDEEIQAIYGGSVRAVKHDDSHSECSHP